MFHEPRGPLSFNFVVLALGVVLATCQDVKADSPNELFEQRIMPIFKSPEPSSCVQCHLASVDLKDYILPSAEQTFVSLRDQGLVDLKKPKESKILKLIAMGAKDADKGAKLIHEKQRDAEYKAFSSWINACCADPRLRELAATPNATVAKPDKSLAVIRHNRKDRVLDSFVRNIWSQRMRCFPCHTPNELDGDNPKHEKPIARHGELEKQFGQRINIFRETPEATMKALIVSSQRRSKKHLPLINTDDPRQSLLVLKPTSKLPAKIGDGKFARPSSIAPVSHMGGLKMHIDDHSYKAFVAWIQDYSRVVNDAYTEENLPADNWIPTKHFLRLKEVPENWSVGDRVQLVVHGWDAKADQWHVQPVAFTQGTVTPRRFVNGVLFMLVNRRVATAEIEGRLQSGKYTIKVYLDSHERLSNEPTLMLGSGDFVGDIEVKAHWREGFPNAEVVSGSKLARE